MIQGTSSGAGKTTLVAALCRIFSNAGYSVAPFKSQNMSNFSYKGKDFEISRAQAIQAVAARAEITPDMNPILLKPRGNYWSSVFLQGKYYKKLHANEYYKKFVLSKGLELVSKSLHTLQKKLLRKKILIRDASTFRGLDKNHIRIAVKSHKENVKLVKALGGI